MHQDHRRVLLAHLVEGRPDPAVVVVVDPAREGDARTGREKDSGLGPALGVEEIARAIIAAMSVRWLTVDPDRGRQAEPVWAAPLWQARK